MSSSDTVSARLQHFNPNLFPELNGFKLERWLSGERDHLIKYLVNFSRGTRQCIGMNLARVEIFFALTAVSKI